VTKLLGSIWVFVAAVLIIVVVVAVLVPTGSTVADRVAHLESLVKCPACDDLSVAESNAPSAIAVRHEIVAKVQAGLSDTQILTALESQYGPTVLLDPNAGSLGDLLWIVPIVVFVGGLVIYGRLVRRR
jgi:cytochrome c-type biogenesis protein CcmH